MTKLLRYDLTNILAPRGPRREGADEADEEEVPLKTGAQRVRSAKVKRGPRGRPFAKVPAKALSITWGYSRSGDSSPIL